MATIKENPEEQGFFTVETPKKDVINVLGTQGLMYNDYSMPQHKVLMTIIKHGQAVIKQYIVPRKICHQSTILTPDQVAAGYVDVDIPLKEFGFSATNYTWLKGVLDNMGELPIAIPFRTGNITQYMQWPRLFKAQYYKKPSGQWMAKLRFRASVMNYFFAFDKGVTNIDLGELNLFRNVCTRKLYVILRCWADHGFTTMGPLHLMRILKGREAYTYYSDLENKQLLIAQQEMKALYDKGVLDSYFTYLPYYPEGLKTAMPTQISITRHYRKYQEPTEEIKAEQKHWQLQLKLKLMNSYDINEETAIDLSRHMRIDYVGELHNWFLHKDYFIKKCQQEHRPMKKSGYIVTGLNGFFSDKESA